MTELCQIVLENINKFPSLTAITQIIKCGVEVVFRIEFGLEFNKSD